MGGTSGARCQRSRARAEPRTGAGGAGPPDSPARRAGCEAERGAASGVPCVGRGGRRRRLEHALPGSSALKGERGPDGGVSRKEERYSGSNDETGVPAPGIVLSDRSAVSVDRGRNSFMPAGGRAPCPVGCTVSSPVGPVALDHAMLGSSVIRPLFDQESTRFGDSIHCTNRSNWCIFRS